MMATSKTAVFSGVEEPKEAMIMEALSGLSAVRSWMGRSFCVCVVLDCHMLRIA